MDLLIGLLLVLGLSPHALAQDPPRFQPPRPPALDQDFEDSGEDDFDGDQPTRAPPPAVSGTSGLNAPAPAPVAPSADLKPSTSLNNGAEQNKLRFKVVDGAFYEKGKRRGRAPLNKRTQ